MHTLFFTLVISIFTIIQATAQEDLPSIISGVAIAERPVDRYVANKGELLTFLSNKKNQGLLGLSRDVVDNIALLKKQRHGNLLIIYKELNVAQTEKMDAVDRANYLSEQGDRISKLNSRFEELSRDLLDSDDIERLGQLVLWDKVWHSGFINVVLDTELKNELELSIEDRTKLKEAATKLREDIEAFNKTCFTKIQDDLVSMLEAEQKKLLNEMLGEGVTAQRWRSVPSEMQLKILALHWTDEEKRLVFGEQVRPEASFVPSIDISQYSEHRFAMMLMDADMAKEIEITKNQEAQVQQLYQEFRIKFKNLIKENDWLRKKDIGQFRELTKEAEVDFQRLVFTDVLMPHQTKRLKRLFYTGQVRENGLLNCLLDSNENSIGRELKITAKQRAKLKSRSVESALEIRTESRQFQERSANDFKKVLNVKQRKRLDEIMGEPPENTYATLDSIYLQLLFAIKRSRPTQ